MSEPRELLTIAVPCLNEEENIVPTVDDIMALVGGLEMDTDVVLIDDGSTDRTLSRMEELAERYDSVRVVVNERNMGPGRSVLSLYDQVDPRSWFTALPGDNEIVASSLGNYFAVRQDYDIVLGYLQNPVIRTPTRRLASAIFTMIARATYGFAYRYLNGPKLYRVEVFQGIRVVGGSHAFNAELLAKAILRNPSLRISEAPFIARGRAMGSTKAFTLRNIRRSAADFYRGYRDVVRYREHVISGAAAKGRADHDS